jgi:diguanylate cyclase (GGDEF)-like protein
MESRKIRRFAMPAQVAFLLATLWAFVGYWSYSERLRIIELNTAALEQLTASVSEQVLRLFKTAESALLAENDWLIAHPHVYPNNDPSFVSLVDRQRRLADGFLDMRTLDSRGGIHLIPSFSRVPIGTAVDHANFRVQLDSKTQEFYIDAPLLSRTADGWIIPISIPATDNQADVAVLAAIIELNRLTNLFEPQRKKKDGTIIILKPDGTTLFRVPAISGSLGKVIYEENLTMVDHGVFHNHSPYDNIHRIVSFQKLKDYPLIVMVSAGFDEVLLPWWHETLAICIIASLITLLTGFMTARFLAMNRAALKRIKFLAYHDALTGLPNRQLAKDRFSRVIAHADRVNAKAAMLFIDLDNFKMINDSLGHAVGDMLLKEISARISDCVRETDTICRHGGDEFVVLLSDVHNDGISGATEKILKRLDCSFDIEGHTLLTSVSIGIAAYPDDGRDFETLLKKSDTAMYRAKESGRNTYHFYNEEMNTKALETLQLRNGLRQALAKDEFVLHYQPQIDLTSGRVVGVEALIRWNHRELGMVPPGRFIPLAEHSGLIVQIGEWVIAEACRQAVAWQRAGLPELMVAVNLSALQLRRGNLERTLIDALEQSGLDPRLLELELTESSLIQDTQSVHATLEKLKRLGLRLAIDDFGTGYSSLSYLKRLKVDRLKIDQSFVRGAATDPENAAIVRTIIQMAKSLNLKTIAEGVEDAETLGFLRLCQCDEAQGYHIGRPMAPDALAASLVQVL